MISTPDIHYDARHGWFEFTPKGRIRPLKDEPFDFEEEAIAYALAQLRDIDGSLHARVINARKALEWATTR